MRHARLVLLSSVSLATACGIFKKQHPQVIPAQDHKVLDSVASNPYQIEKCTDKLNCSFFANIPAGSLYKSCSEVETIIAQGREFKNEMYKAASAGRNEYASSRNTESKSDIAYAPNDSKSEVASGSGKPADISSNVQEKGVDESDLYKVSATHIFAVQGLRLVTIDRKTLQLIGTQEAIVGQNAELYTVGEKLIIVDRIPNNYQEFRVRVFSTIVGKLPELKKEIKYKGTVKETRFENGRLILVSGNNLGDWDSTIGKNISEFKDISCDKIVKPQVFDGNEQLTTLRALSISDYQSSEVTFMGNVSQVYMAPGSIYLSQPVHNLAQAEMARSTFMPVQDSSSSIYIQSFSLSDKGEWGNFAVGMVPGQVKDKWAFQELKSKYLAIATTTGYLHGTGENQAKNHLFLLEKKGPQLSIKGSVRDFGLNEDIRSVRYIKDMAYVVTFKKTDPLFAISLTDPENPKLLGELKVPGFSAYMQPLSDNIIAGIGYDAVDANSTGDFAWYQGIQVSLFDVTQPQQMKRLDAKILGDRGSYSEATSNSHAFFYDPEQKILGIPVTLLKNPNGATGGSANSPVNSVVNCNGMTCTSSPGRIGDSESKPTFSGAIFYDVSKNTLNEVARISHAAWLPSACASQNNASRWWQDSGQITLDIARIFKVDGNLLSLSPFGIKSWANGIGAAANIELQFPGSTNDSCQRPIYAE